MRSVKYIETAKAGYIILSVFFCITGGLMIAMPDLIAPVIGRILGISLILFGAVKLLGYYSKDLFRLTFQFDLSLGILVIILGLIMLIRADLRIINETDAETVQILYLTSRNGG